MKKQTKDIIEIISKPSKCPYCKGEGYILEKGITRFCIHCIKARGDEQYEKN